MRRNYRGSVLPTGFLRFMAKEAHVMPPTFKVVVAHCAVGGALSNKFPEGILMCEGAMSREAYCRQRLSAGRVRKEAGQWQC